jgi:type I restriction enzyme, R subunit
MLHGVDYSGWATGSPGERMRLIPVALEHILAQEDGQDRFSKAASELTRAFALAVPLEEAEAVRAEMAFFQQVSGALPKTRSDRLRNEEEMGLAIRQIVSGAIAPRGVIDIFEAAGLPKPDISILSPEFLAEVRDMPHRNLAVELLKRLLEDEIRERGRTNLVQSRTFSEMLAAAVRKYEMRAIEAAQVIEELIELAREMREAQKRGEELGLSDEELAFYDALETNDSAVKVLGDDALRTIARELTETVRRTATIDWTVKENVRARMRVMVRRILKRHGYQAGPRDPAGSRTGAATRP